MPQLRRERAVMASRPTPPRSNRTGSYTPDHPIGTNQWHQGHAVLMLGGRQCVPFLTKETAQAVAAKGETATGHRMIVLAHQDFWIYRKA